MPYDFTSPTATEHQLEEPAAADANLRAKVGHPVTVYSQETAERVCELIATGHNLRQIEEMRATEPELPARRTIHAWVKTRPDFERAYYIALEMRAIARADEIIEIAFDKSIDVPRARHMTNVLFSVDRKPNLSSPVSRFDRTDAFLLPSAPLRPMAQIANPAPAANKKPGALFLMDSTIPTPNAQPTLRPTR